MRQIVHLIIIYAALLTLAGCGDGKSVRQLPHLGNTPYQQDTIQVTYATNPERALTLLDSALLLGNISEYRGQVIRARIYSKSLVEQRQDSAILICKELLGHDSVRNDPAEQENILDLLIATSRAKPDYEQYIHWATQKAELCQQQGQETERWRSEADIGFEMTHLGQENEGLAKLDEAISHLDAPGSIDRMDAFIVAVKRKINALNAQRRYEEVIPLAQRILDRLDHFESHIKDYAEDSYRLAWNDNPSERDRYLDFSRAQAWGFMAIAYSHTQNPGLTPNPSPKGEGNFKGEESRYLSLAKKYLALFDNSNYGKTFSARRMISPAQMALGMYDEALATYDELEHRMGSDTLNENYAIILRSRAIAAREKRNFAEAFGYQTRYADLLRLLSDSLMKSKAHEYAARYHDQEQKLEIAQINAESQRKTIIIWAAVIIIMLISIFATWLLRQWRVIRRKNLVLVEQIGEAIEYKEKYESLTPGPSPMGEGSDYSYGQKTQQVTPVAPAIESDLLSLDDISDDELFRRLRHVIKREHLYLDPSLDRQKIMDIFQLSKRRVGAAFAQGSDFNSLADFIRDCRLEYSCNLLVTRPDLSIKEVAAKSGFNYASTYSADFKNRYTMTPSNYRELKAKR